MAQDIADEDGREGDRAPRAEGPLVTARYVFGSVAVVLVLLAAIADHAIGWGTGVAVLLTAHSLWRQRRIETRIERRLAQSPPGPPDPWPAYWPPEWRRRR